MKIIAPFLSVALLVSSNVGSFLFGLDYVSQAGQDKWVIEEVFNFKRNGYFVDIGAADVVGTRVEPPATRSKQRAAAHVGGPVS